MPQSKDTIARLARQYGAKSNRDFLRRRAAGEYPGLGPNRRTAQTTPKVKRNTSSANRVYLDDKGNRITRRQKENLVAQSMGHKNWYAYQKARKQAEATGADLAYYAAVSDKERACKTYSKAQTQYHDMYHPEDAKKYGLTRDQYTDKYFYTFVETSPGMKRIAPIKTLHTKDERSRRYTWYRMIGYEHSDAAQIAYNEKAHTFYMKKHKDTIPSEIAEWAPRTRKAAK